MSRAQKTGWGILGLIGGSGLVTGTIFCINMVFGFGARAEALKTVQADVAVIKEEQKAQGSTLGALGAKIDILMQRSAN